MSCAQAHVINREVIECEARLEGTPSTLIVGLVQLDTHCWFIERRHDKHISPLKPRHLYEPDGDMRQLVLCPVRPKDRLLPESAITQQVLLCVATTCSSWPKFHADGTTCLELAQAGSGAHSGTDRARRHLIHYPYDKHCIP